MSRLTVTSARARISAAIVAVCAMGLAACSGSAEGADTPAPVVSPTAPATTAVPSPTAAYKPASAEGPAENVPVPKMPLAAKEKSQKGLKAFVRYWYETLSFAFETGDMGPLMASSGDGCKGCQRIKPVIQEGHSDGKWLVGGRLSVVGSVIERFEPAADGTYQIVSQVEQQEMESYTADGTLIERAREDLAIIDVMNAEFIGGGWRANNVEGMG
ncbi:DUF6318 family protein [Arthrobacter sp. GCM10027362]|uniref:DUF6318 family protein n=1 Tax=Arthrobacter sp. GCM10027362 TaxID=3273379 RepID=UPI00363CC3AC